MAYEYERGIIGMLRGIENRHLIDLSDHKQELKEVYAKAKAFDNYMVDLAKTIELYPHDYIKNSNFAKETYEFYMKSKEDFIKAYKNEVGRKHELIHDIAEYDIILSDLEDKQTEQ